MNQPSKMDIQSEFKALQAHICDRLEKIDVDFHFSIDEWSRIEGGGGQTNTGTNGEIIEKGGVAFSAVHGPITEEMQQQLKMGDGDFFASGVSIVLHPRNVHIPIIHMNVRYFELNDGTYWFGGGIDLTPHYIVPAQAKMFHQSLKEVCDAFSLSCYQKFKTWADDYFFIPHRNETRGIGGIFFDQLKESKSISKADIFQFCLNLGRLFPTVYAQQVALGKDMIMTEEQERWRNLRRGRYVEFNLVNDRGTKFGLHSGGRTESILMSLPPLANWEYNFSPVESSPEALTLANLKKGIDW
jgi:coproporphyrinogen III oxidase